MAKDRAEDINYVAHGKLLEFVAELFETEGLSPTSAREVAECLVAANLRGIDSHGVTRVPIYLRRLREGVVSRQPRIRVEHRSPSVSLVHGDNGVGPSIANIAVDEAIRLAEGGGVGATAVRNSNHYGMAAHYLFKMVHRGLIGLTVTNAPATMAPHGGRSPFFGTNPWAIAAPAGKFPPVLLDMATSVAARGKALLAEQRGQLIPEGWALDPEGRPTTDPTAALVGAVLPFAGPKGSGLAMFADIFAGILAGAAFGPAIRDLYRDLEGPQNAGHFFLALDVTAFLPLPEFERRMEEFLTAMKSLPAAEGHGEVLAPGEPELRIESERLRAGIPIDHETIRALQGEAEHGGVSLPPLSTRALG